jgi:hypothetical protein
MGPIAVTVILVAFALLWTIATLMQRDARWAPVGGVLRAARRTNASAGLVALGLALLACQVAFTDGTRPNLISLPIGMVPLELGLAALGIGLLVGIAAGSPRYRFAVILGLIGAGFVVAAFMTIPFTGPPGRSSATSPRLDLILALATWIVAIGIGTWEVRKGPTAPRDAILGGFAGVAILGCVAVIAPFFLSLGQTGGFQLISVSLSSVGTAGVTIHDETYLVRSAEAFAPGSVALTSDESGELASHHALALAIPNTNDIYVFWTTGACRQTELEVTGTSNHLVVRVDPGPMASGPCEVPDSAITLRLAMLDDVTDTTVDISRADE